MPLWARQILLTASPADLGDAIERHRRHLSDLEAGGRLRTAVEYRRGDGFLEVYEAPDLREAERIARSSPLVEEGMGSWTLRAVESARFS